MTKTTHTKSFAVLAAIFLCGAAFLAMPRQVQSIDYGAGGHTWISTAYAQNNQAACTQSVPDATCKELCLIENGIPAPTGTLCCLKNGEDECPANQTFTG